MRFTRFAALSCAAAMAFAAVQAQEIAAFAEGDENTGICGENVTWSFDEATGTLTISGTGEIKNYYESMEQYPWKVYAEFETLQSVVIEEGVTCIPVCAFAGSRSMTAVSIPSSVKTIENSAFSNCGMTEVILPEGVETIEVSAFFNCTNLKTVSIPESAADISSTSFECTPWFNALIEDDPMVIINHILMTAQQCEGEVVVPEDVSTIGASAFSWGKATAVTLPESVTVIDDYAFSCSSLRSIMLPESVMEIGLASFNACSGLESITILNPDCTIYDDASTISNGCDDRCVYYFNGVIVGYEGSTAQEYAEKCGYQFKVIGDETPVTTEPAEEIVLGDLDGSGSVDIMDVILVNKYLLGSASFTEADKAAADVDGNGEVDSTDSLNILKRVVEIITSFDSLS